MQQCFIFPDTNVFLHYKVIDHIDWLDVLGTKTAILVITPVVIRELNRHKDFPSSAKTRDRAALALKKLHDWSEGPSPIMIRDSVELRFRIQEPLIDFATNTLSRDVSDDYLVASIIEHQAEQNHTDLALVTSDLGLKLKARAHGIPTVQLAADLRLPDELLVSEKRVRDLESEIRRLQNRIPVVKLLFESGNTHLKLTPGRLKHGRPKTVASSMASIRNRYQRMESPQRKESPSASSTFFSVDSALHTVPAEDVAKYNQQLEQYYIEIEQHALAIERFRNLLRRLARINIVALNEGTCPAEGLHLFMHFPDGFELLSKEELPKRPRRPLPPPKPKTPLERAVDVMGQPFYIPGPPMRTYPDLERPAPRNVGPTSIRRTRSYAVEIPIVALKHGFQQALAPLYLLFETIEDAESFTIEYTIRAANLPDALKGQLHVIISNLSTTT